MNRFIGLLIVVVVVAGGYWALSNSSDTYNPHIQPNLFSTIVSNPYFTLVPGTKMVYEAKTEDGIEHIELYVTGETKTVMGVEMIVVWDRV